MKRLMQGQIDSHESVGAEKFPAPTAENPCPGHKISLRQSGEEIFKFHAAHWSHNAN